MTDMVVCIDFLIEVLRYNEIYSNYFVKNKLHIALLKWFTKGL